MINRRKKSIRHRGTRHCGWGSKKHRAAGNRGGKGMAGTGKKADSKKPSIWKERYFGKMGFVSRNKQKIVAQNTGYIESNLEKLLAGNLIKKEGDFYVIDSKKIGFNKLLGKGKVTKKLKIDVPYASKGAIEIIKSAGGTVSCEKEGV